MTVLAAVEGDSKSERVVEVSHELATAFETDLVVLHVLSERDFESIKERSDGEYYVDQGRADAADIAEATVTETITDPKNVKAEGRIGDTVTEILDLADQIDAKHIVIGGRKRTPVGKVVFGSVTQSVLLNASRPVTAVMET